MRRIKYVKVSPSCGVKIYRTADREFIVKTLKRGRVIGGVDGGYFTNDEGDARTTAAAEIRWLRKDRACRS